MNTPGLAIVWSVWSRHRIGFIASAATVAALALVCPLLALVAPGPALAAGSTLPLVFDLTFVLNALLFVEREGSLTSRSPAVPAGAPRAHPNARVFADFVEHHDRPTLVGGRRVLDLSTLRHRAACAHPVSHLGGAHGVGAGVRLVADRGSMVTRNREHRARGRAWRAAHLVDSHGTCVNSGCQ